MCYVTNKICYKNKGCISNETDFIKLLIQNTKPITAGIIHKLPDQSRLLDISDSLNEPNILNAECYILEAPNKGIPKNCTMFTEKNKNIVKGKRQIKSYLKLKSIWNFAEPLYLNI